MQKTTGGHHKPALPTGNSQSSNTVHSWLKKKKIVSEKVAGTSAWSTSRSDT